MSMGTCSISDVISLCSVLFWLMCSNPWNENEIHFDEVKVMYIKGHITQFWSLLSGSICQVACYDLSMLKSKQFNLFIVHIFHFGIFFLLKWDDWIKLQKSIIFKKIHINYVYSSRQHQIFQCFLLCKSLNFR